ncbi:MAG: DNA alkylation repair protein [Mastigocoleus sp.]|mgnify:CR=1 FL=1
MSKKRTGARRIVDVPHNILEQINKGEIETVNLTECLAIDFVILLKSVFPKIDQEVISKMSEAAKLGWMERTRLAARLVYQSYGLEIVPTLLMHSSDNVRGWTSGVIAAAPELSLQQRLEMIQPLANDTNSGTRETAWLLMRNHIASDVRHSIKLLTPWTYHEQANIRRFATESTRPRGVWCSHIPLLKEQPEIALPLLEPLHSDPSRYVQNSVANWLNDAAKSQPEWVKSLTKKWLDISKTKETQYICKRSTRSL